MKYGTAMKKRGKAKYGRRNTANLHFTRRLIIRPDALWFAVQWRSSRRPQECHRDARDFPDGWLARSTNLAYDMAGTLAVYVRKKKTTRTCRAKVGRLRHVWHVDTWWTDVESRRSAVWSSNASSRIRVYFLLCSCGSCESRQIDR